MIGGYLFDDHFLIVLTSEQKMYLAIIVNVCMAVIAYVVADRLISSHDVLSGFIRANLFGKDMNKTSEARV